VFIDSYLDSRRQLQVLKDEHYRPSSTAARSAVRLSTRILLISVILRSLVDADILENL